MSGAFTADRIDGHDHSRQIVLIEVVRVLSGKTENLKDSTDVHDLFSALTRAIYSASEVERATESCRRDFQLIGPPLNMRTKPV